MRPRSLLACALLLPSTSCRDREAAPPPGADAPRDAPPPVDAAGPAAGDTQGDAKHEAPARPAEPTPEQLAQARKAFVAALDEGRALTRKEDYAAGIAKYREALAIDGSDPAALGELGWAAFLTDDLEVAERSTEQALRFARRETQRGMLLYNLGRVLEARGDAVGAIELYHRSLAARPNATVQKRLVALSAPPAPAATVPTAALAVVGRGLADLKAACDDLVAKKCDEIAVLEKAVCACEPRLEGADAGGTWGLLRVNPESALEQTAWFPAVKVGSEWVVFEGVLWLYNPGAFGIWEEADVGKAATRDVIPGGEEELVLPLSKSRSDRDMGLNEWELELWSLVLLCSRDGGTPRCGSFTQSYSYSREVELPDDEIEGGPFDHTAGLPLDSHYRVELDLSAGRATVSGVDVTADLARPDAIDSLGAMLPEGTYDLTTLLMPPP